jgi:hypothetical protein
MLACNTCCVCVVQYNEISNIIDDTATDGGSVMTAGAQSQTSVCVESAVMRTLVVL